MSQQLINHSSDLKRLRDEGYQLEIYGGHLIVHHIPYVTSERKTELGVFSCPLSISGNKTGAPPDHVMKFSGSQPCDSNGRVITGIVHRNLNESLGNGLMLNLSFSNKPPNGYGNYYEKVTQYAKIISAPAIFLDETLTYKPYKPIVCSNEESVFKYLDTNSSRANIEAINNKLETQRIALVGLGGTGSYILDFVSKTCVQEIHLFDGDYLLNHNAFRSPGAVSLGKLIEKPLKVDYYAELYSEIRRKIVPHGYYVFESNFSELKEMDYVFLCIDNNNIRNQCIDFLTQSNIPFIDVGLGVNVVDHKLIGTVRVTTGTGDKNDHLLRRIPKGDDQENEYSTNIQIADLNAMNAILAVIKWKKLSGIYQDLSEEHHSTYSINVSQLLNEEFES